MCHAFRAAEKVEKSVHGTILSWKKEQRVVPECMGSSCLAPYSRLFSRAIAIRKLESGTMVHRDGYNGTKVQEGSEHARGQRPGEYYIYKDRCVQQI